jgi:hypothetical protein
MQRDLPADCQQNRAMKNCEKRHARSKRHGRATPPSSGRPRVCLTVSGHESDSISALTKSKEQMTLPDSNIGLDVFGIAQVSSRVIILRH